MRISKRELALAAGVMLITALGIFFTPLRYSVLVEPSIQDVEPEKIYASMMKNPDGYLFIDVRSAAEYQKIHAKDSVNIPIHLLYDGWRGLPKTGKQIVLICGGGRLSGVAFFFLQHFGFTNIARVSGGIENWVSKNLPVVLRESPK